MKQYLSLQFKFTNRKLIELGINPLVGYVIGTTILVLLSEFIFLKTEFAKYVILLFALSLLMGTSGANRVEFLKIVFGDKKSQQLRVLENLIICTPFMVILLFHKGYLEAILLLLCIPFFAFFLFKNHSNFTLPTPFYKYPFEFLVGFRNSIIVFPIAYLLTFAAIYVDNFNLGVFALLLVFLVSITFHVKPENEYFVWSYATKPSIFLWRKIGIASMYSTLLALPIVSALIVFYPSEIYIILMSVCIGTIFLWTVILAKYSTYPNEINLPEGILIALCIYLPILLLLLIPYFYIKSIRKLTILLK